MRAYQLSPYCTSEEDLKEAAGSLILTGLTLPKWLEAQGTQRWQQGREGSCPASCLCHCRFNAEWLGLTLVGTPGPPSVDA